LVKKRHKLYYEGDGLKVAPTMVSDIHKILREHDHIITILALYEYKGYLHFVFPFVEGNLYEFLRGEWKCTSLGQCKSSSWADSKLWSQAIGVCTAAVQFHGALDESRRNKRITAIHFDLKPDNLLITTAGVIKVADFGQCMLFHSSGGDSGRTVDYQPGDPEYSGPEAQSSQATQAHDVWQLGCIILEVVIFLTFGSAEVKTFSQERGVEGSKDSEITAAFYCRAESGDVKLKQCVEDRLEALFEAGVSKSKEDMAPFQIFLGDLGALLRKMLSINPDLRPQSSEVVKKLERQVEDYKKAMMALSSDYLTQTLEAGHPQFSAPQGMYSELGWGDGPYSFTNL
jgi:serine/threonine protein kinase